MRFACFLNADCADWAAVCSSSVLVFAALPAASASLPTSALRHRVNLCRLKSSLSSVSVRGPQLVSALAVIWVLETDLQI